MKQPIKMTPGDELHLTALMAPFSLNLVTGQDRQHLLGYGRAAFEAGQAGQCLHQIQEPAAAEQAAWHAGLDEGRAQAAQPEDARELVTLALGLSLPPKGGPSFAWSYLLSSIRELVKCEEELTLLKAGMEMSKAAPAAVAALLEALESIVDVCEGHDFDGAPSDAHMEKARSAISAYRAALAATPAAAPVVLPEPEHDDAYTRRVIEALHENGDPVSVDAAEEMERLRALLATATGLPAQAADALLGDEDRILVPRGLLGAACCAIDKKRDSIKTLAELRRYTTGDLSAAWPAVGEPVARHGDDVAVDALTTLMKAKLVKRRAKGYSGWDDSECTREWLSKLLREHVDKGDPVDVANFCAFLSARGEGIAPQAQADARDADGEAFRTAARLGLTLRFYGNCAQSGAPGTPSVYEVTTGPDSAEAMRASIDRAAIAAAKGD